MVAVEGHQDIEGVISGVRKQFPGYIFRLTSNADAHHNVVRFRWKLVPEGKWKKSTETEVVGQSWYTGARRTLGWFASAHKENWHGRRQFHFR